MVKFCDDFVLIDLEVSTSNEVISALAERLHSYGYVDDQYGDATIVREHEHPTGLPTKPFCIAFPHADPVGVSESALAYARLKTPVMFKNMADPEEDLEVCMVFILANKSPEEQIEVLRNLSLLFSEPEKLQELRKQDICEDAAAWLKRELRLS